MNIQYGAEYYLTRLHKVVCRQVVNVAIQLLSDRRLNDMEVVAKVLPVVESISDIRRDEKLQGPRKGYLPK